MENYLGVKVVSAEQMKLSRWNHIKSIPMKTTEEEKEGYQVIYEDRYVSWSPKDIFEKAYRRIDNLTFGLAIEALKQGKKVARIGWNGKGMYLWLLPATEVRKEWVKDPMLLNVFGDREVLSCLGSIRMLTATGEVLTGWLASQTDMLAEDWCIVE